MNRKHVLAWLVGAVAVLCLGGASWFWQHPATETPSGEALGFAESGVICFGSIDVPDGVRALYPLQPGRVTAVLVKQNQTVAKGDLLFRVDDSAARLQVQEARAGLDAAAAQLAQARQLPQQHQAKKKQLEETVASLKARVSAAENLRTHKQELFDRKFLSPTELKAAQDQVEEAAALYRAEQAKLTELAAQDPNLEVQRATATVAAQKARWQRARQALEDYTVRAPSAGQVLRLLVGPGDVLAAVPKEAVLLFGPAGPRFLRAEVEQEYASQVAPGQAVRMQDDGNPGHVWQGTVRTVADWFGRPQPVLLEPLQFKDVRTLEVLIDLAPNQPPVRIGQRMRAVIDTQAGPQGPSTSSPSPE